MKNPGWIYAAVVAGTCFWWVLALGSTPKHHNFAAPNYRTLQFTTEDGTKEYFFNFIESLRDHLWSGDEVHGIRVMQQRSTVSDNKRFVLVELTNHDGIQMTIAIDVVDAYLVAYRVGDEAFFFEGSSEVAYDNLFTDAARRYTFTFDGSYRELEAVAGTGRENIRLGRWPLDRAIEQLSLTGSQPDKAPVASALLVVIQMFSEAARFNHIVQRVMDNVNGEGFEPDTHMLWLENNWRYVSKTVQEANEAGIFDTELTYQDINGRRREMYGVTGALLLNMGLMLFVCTTPPPASTAPYLMIPHLEIIRGISTGGNGDVSPISEPTVRIIGRGEMCVTVKEGSYADGTALVLSSCKSNDADSIIDQLWTIKTDGTIRSNDKCMTTYGYAPQKYVMIYDCQSAVVDATKWKIFPTGTIKNPKSGLVLQANSLDEGTELVVNTNTAARNQGWVATNNTDSSITPILAFTGPCLQEADGYKVKLDKCDENKVEQKWVLYRDGSIRRYQNQDYCLGYDTNYIVVLAPCDPADDVRRWVFDSDGGIRNLRSGYVLQVIDSDNIVLNAPNGGLNQKWLVNL